MNRARVAALLRELADAIEEDDVPEAEGSRPRAKRPVQRRPRLPVVSGNVQVSDVDRAAARAHLRRTGRFIEVKR